MFTNRKVYSPDGVLMFLCNDKRIAWYLRKGLAKVISTSSSPSNPNVIEAIQLTFQPNGLGRASDTYYLQELENKCFSCGVLSTKQILGNDYKQKEADSSSHESSLSNFNSNSGGDSGNSETRATIYRFHVVPSWYRRFFPLEYKSRSAHDVVRLCKPCIQLYDKCVGAIMNQLAKDYNAPVYIPPVISDYETQVTSLYKQAGALVKFQNKLPREKVVEFQRNIVSFMARKQTENEATNSLNKGIKGNTVLTTEQLKQFLAESESYLEAQKQMRKEKHKRALRNSMNLQLNDEDSENDDDDDKEDESDEEECKDHGKMVMEQVLKANELQLFVQKWRKAFVHSLRPRYLPQGWSITRSIEDR